MFLKLNKKRIINAVFFGIALPLVVVSCGGGGSDSAAPASPALYSGAVPANQLAIDESTARNITSTFSGSANSTLNITEASKTSSNSTKQSIVNLSKRILQSNQTGTSVIGAAHACENSDGSISGPDFSPLPGTFGSFTMTAINCRQGTETLNGSVAFNGTVSLDISNNVTAINGTFTFNNLTYSDPNNISSVNGDATVIQNTVNGVATLGLKGNKLTYRDKSSVTELTNFDISFIKDNNTQINTLDVNFTLSNSTIGGYISVATPTTFKISTAFPTKDYPFEGQVVVTGLNDDKFRLTVNTPAGGGIASDTVTIELDLDSTPGYESLQVYMWSEL